MGIHVILSFVLIKSALIFGSSVQGYCEENEWCFENGQWDCVDVNDCASNRLWDKSDSATATVVQFHLRMSFTFVELLSKNGVLQKFEDFLGSKMYFNQTDIFGLRANPSYLFDDKDSTTFTFALQPGAQDLIFAIYTLRQFQDCSYYCQKDRFVEIFGNNIFVVGGHFNVEPADWNGLKTVVRFDLDIEYSKLESIGMIQTKNALAIFLLDTVELRSRDIYDLTILNSVTKSTVMFSLPPIIEHDLQTLLQSIDTLMNKPCIELCMGETNIDECKNCKAVSLPGANIYPAPRSLQTHITGWTGSETKFKKKEVVTEVCTEHQEVCRNIHQGTTKCVGIGTCDKYFYKSLEVTLLVHGHLLLFDVQGMEFALTSIEQTLEDLFNFCKGSITAEMFDTGRTTTGIRVIIALSIGRTDGMVEFDETIRTQDTIRIMELDISKVEGSYAKTYLDTDKPVARYLADNACFNCRGFEVWCITTAQSLCLQKKLCIAEHLKQLKLAEDTDLIRVSFLVKGREENISWTDDVKVEMKYQIIDVIGCGPDQVRDLQIVPYDTFIWEVGFELLNKDNLTELTEHLYEIRLRSETEDLVLYTHEDNVRSLETSFLFQQLIFGHEKHVAVTKKSGNVFVTASGLFVLVFILVLPGIIIIKRRSSFKSKSKR